MTTLPATTSSYSALYPLKRDDGIAALVQEVLTFETQDGKPVLHRKLAIDEREILNRRAQELGEHLKPAHHSKIRALVSQMLAGFNKAAGGEVGQRAPDGMAIDAKTGRQFGLGRQLVAGSVVAARDLGAQRLGDRFPQRGSRHAGLRHQNFTWARLVRARVMGLGFV